MSQSDEPNTMECHSNILLYSDEGLIKASNTDHTKNIILVPPEKISFVSPEDKFVCNAQVIMAKRGQGRKLGLDTSRIFIDYDSNIIGRHRNTLLPVEGSNKVSKPGLDTASKYNLETTQCAK